MYQFLANNRQELIERCRAKVALREKRGASVAQLQNGVPLFLDQLTRTLRAEDDGHAAVSLQISGPSGGDSLAMSEIGVSAAAHGRVLLGLGFTVDQVVHDYGDLCQAITDLAVERDAPFSIDVPHAESMPGQRNRGRSGRVRKAARHRHCKRAHDG